LKVCKEQNSSLRAITLTVVFGASPPPLKLWSAAADSAPIRSSPGSFDYTQHKFIKAEFENKPFFPLTKVSFYSKLDM